MIILWIIIPLFLANAAYSATRTFYIDFETGKDVNSGTSTASPWKKAPIMAGFSGTYSHQAGDRFIFKGGVTWDKSNFGMDIHFSGTSTAPDYYGVDTSWFKGTSWLRPIFNGGHTTLAQGSDMITINNQKYVTIDNIEIKGYQAYASWGNGSITLYCSQNILMTNLWVHDWSLASSVGKDDAHGGIIGNYPSCRTDGTWLDNSEISNAEAASVGRQNGVAVRNVNIRFSKIHDVSTAQLFGSLHDTEIYNVGYPDNNKTFDSSYHTNVTYIIDWEGMVQPINPAYIYNNVIHDVWAGSGAFYPNGCNPIYIFNNVVWNNYWGNNVQMDPYGGSTGCGSTYIFNNTLVKPSGFDQIRVVTRGFAIGRMVIQNNHFIQDGSGHLDSGNGVQSLTNDHNLEQSTSKATTEGYTIANRFRPVSAAVSTNSQITPGVNLTGLSINNLILDIVGINRPSNSAWDIGAYQYSVTSPITIAPPTNLKLQ
ncbi:MAG: hypothetical protein WCP96_09605 [Methylococcaceae bacterium]